MDEVIAKPRTEMSPYAHAFIPFTLSQTKSVRSWPWCHVIRSIQDECNVKITTFDDGRLEIAATSDADAKEERV